MAMKSKDPTYILKATDSDLTGGADFNKVLSTGAETAGSITVEVAQVATEDSFGFPPPNVPYNAEWETGDWTVEVNVTTADKNMYGSVAIARVNSEGVQQEISDFAAEQSLQLVGVKTFSFTNLSWSSGALGDRIKVVYRFRNTFTHGAKSVIIETGTVDCEVVSPVTEVPTVPPGTVYLEKATGRRTQLANSFAAIKIDPTTGRRGTDTAFPKFLVREDDGTLRAKSA